MSERTIRPRTYVIVCALLILLTFLTVALSFYPFQNGVWHIVGGLTIALCKMSLVVLFFMHALLGDRVTWSVIAVTCFWLGILLVLTLSDYFSRQMVPSMLGH